MWGAHLDKRITVNGGFNMNEILNVYRVGFNGNDETEVDAANEDEAIELAKIVAAESGLGFNLDYVEFYGPVKD